MSILTQHPAYQQVDDLIDAIGQRYRVYRLLRGLILFAALLIVSVVTGALAASLLGPGLPSQLLAAALLVVLVAGFAYWVGGPLLFRPSPLKTARLIESRVDGLHDGLTNLLQLARADDLQNNPWLDSVFSEIAGNAQSRRLEEAVRFADLRRPAILACSVALPLLLLAALLPGRFAHGIGQITSPGTFVPTQGSFVIHEVLPGNTTVIKGRSLEIIVRASGPAEFQAVVYFSDDPAPRPMALLSTHADDRRYGHVREHVDQPMQYRIEAGGTQTPWYDVSVIQQVLFTEATLIISPPTYTRKQGETLRYTPETLHGQTIRVQQGSRVQVAFDLDVAVDGAMLQVGEASPLPARREQQGRRFTAEFTPLASAAVSLLLADASGQIIATVPQEPIAIDCTLDAPPAVEMVWPQQDTAIAPSDSVRITARVKDDIAIENVRVLFAASDNQPMQPALDRNLLDRPTLSEVSAVLPLTPEMVRHGQSIWVQVEATDNRDLLSIASDLGPQRTTGRRVEIRFRDAQQISQEEARRRDRIREQLERMLSQQRDLQEQARALDRSQPEQVVALRNGQADLRQLMLHTAQTFDFADDQRVVQRTLQVLAGGTALEAVELASALLSDRDAQQQVKRLTDLDARQRRIVQTLENLLALLRQAEEIAADPSKRRAADLDNPAEVLHALEEALKEFMREEQRILEQTTSLAKKPVDSFDDDDRKLLEELRLSQEKLDAFMQQKISDFSNVAEQDMANASLLRELLEIYTEVTMAKDALSEQAIEMAISHEEMGLELAAEMTTNIEKFLLEKPDRLKWTQEDQLERTEAPMAELPLELEDLIGELMEEQEDLFDDIEDTNANWHDALDKGAGWDAMDGPISNMNAQGVTGNTLPNNNEMSGRSGEGRSGKSQGEMVEETATGKGGRNTPTRLDPTAFQQGQIKDVSTDPVGGATGGGKLSGQGGVGLEGPVPPNTRQDMERLRQRQAELRNSAERLNLQYQLGRYDNFKLLESVAIMRRLEADLGANRYQNALRRRDILLDRMDVSRTLLGGEVSVQHDTTPANNRKQQQEINDAMRGPLPPAWEPALREYYRRLSEQ